MHVFLSSILRLIREHRVYKRVQRALVNFRSPSAGLPVCLRKIPAAPGPLFALLFLLLVLVDLLVLLDVLLLLIGLLLVSLLLLLGLLRLLGLLLALLFLGLLGLGQMGVHVEGRADLVPVGEAALLHPRAVANQIRAVLLHVVAEGERDLLVDVQNLSQVREGDNIELQMHNE